MSEYADWPTLEELRKVLDVDPGSTRWNVTLDRVLESAIQITKDATGAWDDLVDEPPTPKLAQAALAKAEFLSRTPESAAAIAADARYMQLIQGHRRRFAIS